MSHLPGEALSYETVVAEYFLGLRGAGLMLSPLDLEQVRAWERRGLPVPVVCRGLRRGLEDWRRDRAGAPPPRALRAYRLAVEDEWRAYRGGRLSFAAAGPALDADDEAAAAARRLTAARAQVSDALAAAGAGAAARADGYRAAARALAAAGAATTLEDVERALAEADAAMLRAWRAALPRAERAALGPRCRLRAGARGGATRAAYRAALQAHLADAAREAGLLALRGSV